jgi:two-component system sensor histidine kinase/response regulator
MQIRHVRSICAYIIVVMILVVDDDLSFLELASKILNRDRQVFLAFDAQQAFQLTKHLGFSVALVDLDLKGKDGLSLIERLRENFPDLPIIAISSALSGRELEHAMELGVVEVLHKPITPEWRPVVERIRATRAH